MRKLPFIELFCAFSLLFPSVCRADLFGADVAVLTQILVNNIQQLTNLSQILERGKRQVELMEDVKQEVFRTIDNIRSLKEFADPNIYKDWNTVEQAIQRLEAKYGKAIPSPDYEIQKDSDHSVAEAIALNNHLFNYSKQLDQVGEQIKQASQSVSPGGAQKVVAHSQGVLLHVMNQNLRAQATLIKLQAQNMAIQNRQEKLITKNQLLTSQEIERELRKKKPFIQLPRF